MATSNEPEVIMGDKGISHDGDGMVNIYMKTTDGRWERWQRASLGKSNPTEEDLRQKLQDIESHESRKHWYFR